MSWKPGTLHLWWSSTYLHAHLLLGPHSPTSIRLPKRCKPPFNPIFLHCRPFTRIAIAAPISYASPALQPPRTRVSIAAFHHDLDTKDACEGNKPPEINETGGATEWSQSEILGPCLQWKILNSENIFKYRLLILGPKDINNLYILPEPVFELSIHSTAKRQISNTATTSVAFVEGHRSKLQSKRNFDISIKLKTKNILSSNATSHHLDHKKTISSQYIQGKLRGSTMRG